MECHAGEVVDSAGAVADSAGGAAAGLSVAMGVAAGLSAAVGGAVSAAPFSAQPDKASKDAKASAVYIHSFLMTCPPCFCPL
jgi:hypothetical protein